ncbi:uncharacterized protein PV09_06310 [Verruconis gallopava]|uniref:Centrosomin N-terminal motif 1 domain-containing protein n=1 Tax=Verruconis gallopava TaxID=253628 RepID=A0A0D1XJP5_9PEZI|nr:uncharacterized protein PV09_06310 [Verruconis gallopava]KIW02511.1 hypothetical protein PV09_06310 [Verruconis gallopava]
MSSTNTTPKYFTPAQYPVLPRRTTVTPSQRPSTSGGDGIEPKSDILRDALREKKGLPVRSQSTTPRKNKSSRPPVNQVSNDELFLPSSDDEATFSGARRPLFRQRARRASEVAPAKPSLNTQARNLGLREADAQMDKLLKENWDLKHRITLRDDAFSKLRNELDTALEELEKSRSLRDRNRELQEAIESISRQAAQQEEENRNLKIHNAELTVLNDDLMRELESKDEGIQQRQLAIEEAAGIIQQLEEANEALMKQQLMHSPRPDSDYFSGEAEGTPSMKMSMRPATAGTFGTECTNPPDSDYFSADSPSLAPTTPKRTPSSMRTTEKSMQMERARAMGATFNREIGLRSQASKDSLFSTFLETPLPESSKRLRRGASRAQAPPLPKGSIREQLQRAGTPPWSDARALRAIYEDGALQKRIGTPDPIQRTGYTPSVTVASCSRAPSFDDMFALNNIPVSVPSLSSLATSVSDSVTTPKPIYLSQSTTAACGSRKASDISANPTPVNYSAWPRKLPDWPPSAGLRNRDILFHGTGMDEMFPESPPRPSSSRESFSNVHLLRSSAGPGISLDQQGRSSSAAPTAGAVAPPPPKAPLNKTTSQHKGSASVSLPRWPAPLERSRTLPLQ